MVKKVIEASEAVAHAVRLCRPGVIPMYPITPQTHIVEKLADFVNNGELDSEVIHCESEHSAISAAIGSQATGTRTFTATASQGLALMHEILFIASGMRMPIVMAVANRALAAPINIWNDQQDSISSRDSGWIQLYVESAQEAFDTTIQAFKIGEDKKIMTPVMVCLDGFTLSHVYEPVDIPEEKEVDKFLPKYEPVDFLDVKNPKSFGAVAFPDTYMGFKKEQQDVMILSLENINKANLEFTNQFNRSYGDGILETYMFDDVEYAIMGMGTICGTSRVVIDELRKNNKKVGMIKIRCYRPFPKDQLNELVKKNKNLKGIAIIDRDISLGHEGALYSDVRSAMFGKDIIINGFIAGLGGKDVTQEDIKAAFESLKKQQDVTWCW